MNIVKKLSLFIASTVILFGFAAPVAVYAASDNAQAACEGLALTGSGCDSSGGGKSIDDTIKLVINVLSLIVGVAAVIMIIIGGLKYILSQGEGSNTASAKNTIMYALIGLVIVALAQIIVRFVLSRAT